MTYIKETKAYKNEFVVDTDNFSSQVVSTTLSPYNGTEITYTPEYGSSNVVYEVNFAISPYPDPKGSYFTTRVQYSDDDGLNWSTIDGTRVFEGTFSSASDYDWIILSYTFILSSWTGERKIRLAGRSYNTSSDFTIGSQHYITNQSGVAACPHISIFSVKS